ncbi:Putative C2H2 type zinc finger domain-containing protein [Aspergillus calidoustus]|uniref:Putative C2H2 type zinc finger domain-containing protein n=1 Tax=Aspergillus calidoustus TaxID=454130 RepID=A0A0U5CJZ3_ASPCI|nr:Putative C2H2 type zinc finger domain-containing protein [Aspergillus calidoustus]
MAPRGFTNPAPKSARSALSSFTCTLCNKSYSRHPEYEAHISSYDHQHRKRLQDLKQLSRDPLAAEKARRAEKKADAEAGLRVLDAGKTGTAPSSTTSSGGGGGFKKGGFKSSFTTVKGPAAKKNVLGEDDDEGSTGGAEGASDAAHPRSIRPPPNSLQAGGESDTDEQYAADNAGGGYYDPRRPTDCFPECAGSHHIRAQAWT